MTLMEMVGSLSLPELQQGESLHINHYDSTLALPPSLTATVAWDQDSHRHRDLLATDD